MEIFLLNTSSGLIPMYDADYDEKRKLKIGQTYKAIITVPRNIDFHRKYFAMLRCAWSLLTQAQREFFHDSEDVFRSTVQIAAGFSKKYYSITHKEWREESVSISFSKMDDATFQDLYNRVFDVILTFHISETDFNTHLINFM
jgi:hypothetical protein